MRQHCRFSSLVIMAWVCTVFSASTDFYGTVAGIRGLGWIDPQPLIIVDIPTMQTRELAGGACYGPCFSPDGSKIAFMRGGEIFVVNSNGSSVSPQGTGIKIPVGKFQSYPALYWLKLSTGEYFYWSRNNVAGWAGERISGAEGLFRCKVGTTVVEHIIDGPYTWAGFSSDGSRAVAMTSNYQTVCFNLQSKTQVLFSGNNYCNTSISPDGAYICHLLGPGQYTPYDEGAFMIQKWWTQDILTTVNADNGQLWDAPRWSHASQNVIVMTYHLNDGNRPDTGVFARNSGLAGTGTLYNFATKEKLFLPGIGYCYSPFDFYPVRLLVKDSALQSPEFLPSRNFLPPGDTAITIRTSSAGASIRYTTDGSLPTAANGVLIAGSSGTVRVTIKPSPDTITIKAAAFKAGVAQSSVTTMRYWAEVPPYAIASPGKGTAYRIGDTMSIRWSASANVKELGVMIRLSVNGGKTFDPIVTNSIPPSSPVYGNYRWVIPPQLPLSSVPVITEQAVIKIEVYGQNGVGSESGIFSIRNASAVRNTGRIAAGAASFRHVKVNSDIHCFTTSDHTSPVLICNAQGTVIAKLYIQANRAMWDASGMAQGSYFAFQNKSGPVRFMR